MLRNSEQSLIGTADNGPFEVASCPAVQRVAAMTAVPINRLALPKGFIPRCEITGLPATLQCASPIQTDTEICMLSNALFCDCQNAFAFVSAISCFSFVIP